MHCYLALYELYSLCGSWVGTLAVVSGIMPVMVSWFCWFGVANAHG
jgi:hypothetical protein